MLNKFLKNWNWFHNCGFTNFLSEKIRKLFHFWTVPVQVHDTTRFDGLSSSGCWFVRMGLGHHFRRAYFHLCETFPVISFPSHHHYRINLLCEKNRNVSVLRLYLRCYSFIRHSYCLGFTHWFTDDLDDGKRFLNGGGDGIPMFKQIHITFGQSADWLCSLHWPRSKPGSS